MAIRLTVCSRCLERDPETQRAIEQLQLELADRLQVITLSCMAACDDTPAAMLDYDYLPRICPHALRSKVLDRAENPIS
jgi:NADH:ubiquinone oxidoreductase subunit E